MKDCGTDNAELAAQLFPAGVVTAQRDPSVMHKLTQREEQFMSSAIPIRRCEFSAGRDAARACLTGFGVCDAEILVDARRAPIWPKGYTGSITHCGDLCLAAVAESDAFGGIGLDVEPLRPLPDDLHETVLLPTERSVFKSNEMLVFCIKEAAYKALSSQLPRLLEFSDLAVSLIGEGRVSVHFTTAVASFAQGFAIPAMFIQTSTHVIVASWLKAEDVPC